MSDVLTSKNGALWIQPDGPNTEVFYMGCHDIDSITAPDGDIEPLRCFNPDGSGWNFIGELQSPPDFVTATISTLAKKQRDYLESVSCPFALYVLASTCGAKDVFTNYVRGEIVTNVRRTQRTLNNPVMREEDVEFGLDFDVSGWELLQVDELQVQRIVTVETENLNDVVNNLDRQCIGDCGDTVDPGDNVEIAAASAVGPAVASIMFSTDQGETFANGATDPFAAGLDSMSVVRFPIDKNTVRILVAQATVGGDQGLVAYSDDAGATWTTVAIGGAAAGHGAVYGGALFALDSRHIWIATGSGFIYFSADGGETWTIQESGVLTAGDYNYIHFADEFHGVACAPADIISVTSDGGTTWSAATLIGGGDDILCVARLDANRIWAGTDEGNLWFSTDGGTTWTQRTGWTGSGVGDVRDLYFVNDYVAFMAYDTAAPIGHINVTINGGQDWARLITPVNAGLNAIYGANNGLAYAVGNTHAATGYIAKIEKAN